MTYSLEAVVETHTIFKEKEDIDSSNDCKKFPNVNFIRYWIPLNCVLQIKNLHGLKNFQLCFVSGNLKKE